MARWFYNRPTDRCDRHELKVANLLSRLSKRWTIRLGFYNVERVRYRERRAMMQAWPAARGWSPAT